MGRHTPVLRVGQRGVCTGARRAGCTRRASARLRGRLPRQQHAVRPARRHRRVRRQTAADVYGAPSGKPRGRLCLHCRQSCFLCTGADTWCLQAFCKVIEKLPTPPPAADPPASFPAPLADAEARVKRPHGIPTLVALGYPPLGSDDAVLFKGGETAGLARLEAHMVRLRQCCESVWAALTCNGAASGARGVGVQIREARDEPHTAHRATRGLGWPRQPF